MGYARGHLDNLDAEQENKLCQMWDAIFKINGVLDSMSRTPDGSTSNQPLQLTSKDIKAKAAAANLDISGLPEELWAHLSSGDPESIRSGVLNSVKHEHPDTLLLRFLRARKWDVNKALVMMFAAIKWRYTEVNLDGDILWNGEEGAIKITANEKKGETPAARTLAGDFLKQVRMGKCFIHGTDREGRPICHVRARLHKASDQCPQSIERYTAYLIETGRLLVHPPVETVVSNILSRHSSGFEILVDTFTLQIVPTLRSDRFRPGKHGLHASQIHHQMFRSQLSRISRCHPRPQCPLDLQR